VPIPQDIVRISDTVWEIPVSHKIGMLVPARIFATETLLSDFDDGVFEQITNVATLPASWVTPAACPTVTGATVSPSAASPRWTPVTGDLPRRHRLRHQLRHAALLTNLTYGEVQPRIRDLVDRIAGRVPAGVGPRGPSGSPGTSSGRRWNRGPWAVKRGFGWKEDLERTRRGCLPGADASR